MVLIYEAVKSHGFGLVWKSMEITLFKAVRKFIYWDLNKRSSIEYVQHDVRHPRKVVDIPS